MPEINRVFRRIRNLPMYIKEDGTISSAIYSDSKGVSVNIDAGRDISDIIEDEEDKKFYEVAKYCNAKLITGNSRHFPKDPLVVTVTDFLQQF